MTLPKASKTRLQIRQSIGYNLGAIIVSTVSATSAADSQETLVDTYGLSKGGDDEYNGRQVQINVPTGDIVAGEKSFVSDFTSTDKSAAMSPAFSDNILVDDTYEMWKDFTIEQVNDFINRAIVSATDDILIDKVDSSSLIKLDDIYEYTIPTGFVALHTVDYEYDMGIYHLLEDCEDVWTEGTNVTATADETFEKVGSACGKFVVVGAGATEILCYEDIGEVDISDCDKVEFWMYSSITLTAGQLQIHIGSTAGIVSAEETIDIPAMTAATWYRHSLSLANPHSDTAIISVGIYQVTNIADLTFYVDDVKAIKDNSRIYRPLSPNMWGIVQASTNLLQLSEVGYSAIGNNKRLRLSGYQIPAELSADTSTSDIDPDFIVYSVTADLLMSKAASRELDPDDSYRRATYFRSLAEKRLLENRSKLAMNCRWVT